MAVVCPQSRFDMSHRYLSVERREGGRHRRRCVTLRQDQVELEVATRLIDMGKDTSAQVGSRLARTQQVETESTSGSTSKIANT